MYKFDTKVQHLKYKVLREVSKLYWKDELLENVMDIPNRIITGKIPTVRCCVYKERAIVAERVKIAMGGDKNNPNVIEVIDIACDECPMGGYEVTNACRGCLAHHCVDACKFEAITFEGTRVAIIDKNKCKECGSCAKVCPYTAIISRRRPCENACKVNAIHMNEDKAAAISAEDCIACGACVYQCPFGAIMEKSYILDAIDVIKKSENNKKYKTYAMIAPAIASQFRYAEFGQVLSGLKVLGFDTVIEAALGADMVAHSESKEVFEKEFVTSSCCPAFVDYVKKNFPDMVPFISSNLSPMATLGKYLKSKEPDCKIVFIGPCTAKKAEAKLDTVKPYIDVVITFEELQALFDSREIDITTLTCDTINDASYYGRVFARSGGLTEAVAQGLREHGRIEFELKAATCEGIEQCRVELLKKSKGISDVNFIEGMACTGGCIGGAGCLTHGEKNRYEVDKYGQDAADKSIHEIVSELNK